MENIAVLNSKIPNGGRKLTSTEIKHLRKLGYTVGVKMRVIDKITQFKYDDGDNAYLRTFGAYNADGEVMVRINRYGLFQAKTLIEATWIAAVDFVISQLPTEATNE